METQMVTLGPRGKTLIDKIWDAHAITVSDSGESLLYIDRNLVHDATSQAFERLELENRTVRRPASTFGTVDHYAPTRGGLDGLTDPARRRMVVRLERDAAANGITAFGYGHANQGIVHVIGPELGITLPGLVLVCGDSHTSTHGALGAFAFGVGATEVAHVLATQTLWQRRPKTMSIVVHGELRDGVCGKDLALFIIRAIGAGGATEHVIEFSGPAVCGLSIEGRLTLCNMAIEAGARAGLVAPDDKTFSYLEGKPYAPTGPLWDQALAYWRTLRSDAEAVFDRQVSLDASNLAPMVTWGTSPEDAVEVNGVVPDPAVEPDWARRERQQRALDYMDLRPGMPVAAVAVDRVFIGSCTNSRIEDLRSAASIIKGRRVVVPTLVVPGSHQVKAMAEAEGLDGDFIAAGAEWRDPGCSMCVGMNGVDVVSSGERCASTSNRNFVGRQGPGARTHLMSPAMAAAAAVTGRLADFRSLARAVHPG
jgi:3-isopropylmalate/(R)-2-methylmalate dehydratase large subunit